MPIRKVFCHTVCKTPFAVGLGLLLTALTAWLCVAPAEAQYRTRIVAVPGQAEPGELVSFGRYPQGEFGEVAPAVWVVLEKDSRSSLLLAINCVDCVPYNDTAAETCWSDCYLRRWLNNDFIAQAFSPSEQALLLNISSKNSPNSIYGTLGGVDTEERVSLLSPEQAEYFIYAPQDRVCHTSSYGIKRGAFVNEDGVCWWWLRSPGATAQTAACVTCDGSLVMEGAPVDRADGCVRPIIRIMI